MGTWFSRFFTRPNPHSRPGRGHTYTHSCGNTHIHVDVRAIFDSPSHYDTYTYVYTHSRSRAYPNPYPDCYPHLWRICVPLQRNNRN
jgi:hypothetical protein